MLLTKKGFDVSMLTRIVILIIILVVLVFFIESNMGNTDTVATEIGSQVAQIRGLK